MIITICGSMQFFSEMDTAKKQLETAGHTVYVPIEMNNPKLNEYFMKTDDERITAKIEYDFIREHFHKIESSEAILVLNHDKKGINGYVGGNTFLEMGYAFGIGKKIYLLRPVPKMDYYTEMVAMQPVVLNGDLTKI
ncbi:MAG: hypothetical protein ABII80_00435 [bacterium]